MSDYIQTGSVANATPGTTLNGKQVLTPEDVRRTQQAWQDSLQKSGSNLDADALNADTLDIAISDFANNLSLSSTPDSQRKGSGMLELDAEQKTHLAVNTLAEQVRASARNAAHYTSADNVPSKGGFSR